MAENTPISKAFVLTDWAYIAYTTAVIPLPWNVVLAIRVFSVTMAPNTVPPAKVQDRAVFLLATASEVTTLTVGVVQPRSTTRLVYEILMPTMRSVGWTV